ncbi:MAG: cyclic nucleotide-binding domain-containing protein [Luteitalea sp.]|nr:cyclic nucleotide-binding domain-containing protein [Luteitalea sp.]
MASDADIAFPKLTDPHIAALTRLGRAREVAAGEVLFAEGDRDFCFFVVLEGLVEIVEHSSGEPRTVTVHEPREFTGDVDMLSGRSALVTARMQTGGHVLALGAEALRKAVSELPELGETLLKAFLTRRALLIQEGFEGIKIIGSRFSPDAHRLRDFANRNAIPFTWLDLETDAQAEALLRHFGIPASATPVVIGRQGQLLTNPTVAELGHCVGLDADLNPDDVYDLVVVGAGPAGLAASVYAASEGLRVVTLDAIAAGGQAGTSSRIENYLGFPTGISGAELTANATLQAQKFGASITVPRTVVGLRAEGGERTVVLEDGSTLRSRCVIVATGVDYRRLDVQELNDFRGTGVYYAATDMEARFCKGEDVVIVGGGNSAGQAIVYLSRYARRVHVVLRANDLAKSMSRYLIARVEQLPNVQIHHNAQITSLDGDGRLTCVRIRLADGTEESVATTALFLFIGAVPRTGWLRGGVHLDKHGFLVTGHALTPETLASERWRAAGRAPFFLETSVPGVFGAGDARSGSVKRVASAVGEGSMAVSFVHAHIGSL